MYSADIACVYNVQLCSINSCFLGWFSNEACYCSSRMSAFQVCPPTQQACYCCYDGMTSRWLVRPERLFLVSNFGAHAESVVFENDVLNPSLWPSTACGRHQKSSGSQSWKGHCFAYIQREAHRTGDIKSAVKLDVIGSAHCQFWYWYRSSPVECSDIWGDTVTKLYCGL